jgi:hypothetical protein
MATTQSSTSGSNSSVASVLCVRASCDCPPPVELGTTYDWSSGCERCGCGATVVKALRVLRSSLPKAAEIAETHCGEYLVTEAIRESLMKRFRVRRSEFIALADPSGRRISGWYMLWPVNQLPPMNVNASGVQCEPAYECEECGRPGHFNGKVKQYVYDAQVWSPKTTPISRTWEHFGRWKSDVPSSEGRRARKSDVSRAFRELAVSTPLIVVRHDVGEWLQTVVSKRYLVMRHIVVHAR